MELVEILKLGGLERQVVCGQRDPGSHDHQLGLEILHHVSEEIISHGMELFVCDLAHLQTVLEFIAEADHQTVALFPCLTGCLLDVVICQRSCDVP